MAFTLFDLLLEAYDKLGQATVSKATGGAVGTLIDSQQAGAYTDADTDDWKGGGIGIVRDSAGASAAPEKEFAFISGFDPSTGTFTFDAAMTVAPASGDTYFFTTSLFPFRNAIEQANFALRSIGDVPLTDITTLDVDDEHSEYSIAVGLKRGIYRVDLQTYTSDANDNQWRELYDWEISPATAGSAANLILRDIPYTNDASAIKIWYRGPHPTLSVASSPILETLDPEYVVLKTVIAMLESYVRRINDAESPWNQALADYKNESYKLELQRGPIRKARHPRVLEIDWNDG